MRTARCRSRGTGRGPTATAPAPFATGHLIDRPNGADALESAFETRIPKVLSVAAFHGHEQLVLGAWGCGAFGNDAEMVARLFRDTLAGSFRGGFSEVVFAITDRSPTRDCIGPFRDAFGTA